MHNSSNKDTKKVMLLKVFMFTLIQTIDEPRISSPVLFRTNPLVTPGECSYGNWQQRHICNLLFSLSSQTCGAAFFSSCVLNNIKMCRQAGGEGGGFLTKVQILV